MDFKQTIRRPALRIVMTVVIVGTAWFFFREFRNNWVSLHVADLQLHYGGLIVSLIMTVGVFSLQTIAWYYGINVYPARKRTSLAECFAIVNTTQMGKYLPGKVWSYAFQILLMERRGVPKSYVLYVNLFGTISYLLITCVLTSLYLLLYTSFYPKVISFLIFCSVTGVYLSFVLLNGQLVRRIIPVVNKLLRRKIISYEFPLPVVLKMQLAFLIANLLFGGAGCAACYGIGWKIQGDMIFQVAIATIFSDLIGFIVVVSPGGLGIREGAMFYLFNSFAGKRVALVAPLVIRIISMAADLIVMSSALYVIQKKRIQTDEIPSTD